MGYYLVLGIFLLALIAIPLGNRLKIRKRMRDLGADKAALQAFKQEKKAGACALDMGTM